MQVCEWHLCDESTNTKFCSRKCKSKYYVAKRRRSAQNTAVVYKGKKCLVCGYQGPSLVYDFHHLNPDEKNHDVNSMWTKSWNLLKEELDKCVMLCPICHRLHHGGLLDLSPHLPKNPSPEEGSMMVQNDGANLPSVLRTPERIHNCKTCGTPTAGCGERCRPCAAKLSPTRICWPSIEEIRERLSRQSFEELARDLGVSSNSIRKRLKNHG
jgi:hypothetical protein